MNQTEFELIKEFKRIANKRWIKSVSESNGSIGLTFEKELGKKPDDLFFPDYYGIELKCTSRFSEYPLYLFSICFDGPTFPEINRLVSLYGWPDNVYLDKNVLYTKLYYNKKTLVNFKYRFQLQIEDERLVLYIYDLNNNLIEHKSFIFLKSIYDHLVTKLSELAYIHASSKKTEDGKYFRYYKIEIYKLISFEKFIDLLKEDKLTINLISRISKSGIRKGEYKNKNLSFGIPKNLITELFELKFSYDYDEQTKKEL